MQGITFVVPCLNEEATLPLVLAKLNTLRADLARPVEVIVSDNGSTDRSVAIAESMGARVVPSLERGYGVALLNGISAASHDIVAFADADDTYDFLEAPGLLEQMDAGATLVIGSRLRGRIYPGAMPFLHRLAGTPMLNFIINALYGREGQRIPTDTSLISGKTSFSFFRPGCCLFAERYFATSPLLGH